MADERSIRDELDVQRVFHTTVRVPGLDGMLVTGGYYDLVLRREPAGWKIERLVEDNRWRNATPPGQS